MVIEGLQVLLEGFWLENQQCRQVLDNAEEIPSLLR
jgi:hypothetical protein